ncbi:type I restriction-modification system, specificity subunit S [Aquipluma nitroreducens]|uniref:Type I restriction-modification system, specificity subunit S n=1 Tax=Aquipluma nitroreducens TaxID=2010828 RepID=A0A5K7S421_9BACT|nr:restriction endonuclease subunit S [Aquipluma nitroreducens]BBE16292.1 type I restriction-modification system, specificity subunit S [Aquipluma nitroreducens]
MSEWKEKTLKDLVEVDPEQLPSSTDADFSFFYIDISSVSLGNVSFPIHSIQYKDAPSRARKILKDNDILMSTVRPNLKAFAQFKKRSKSNFIASTGFAVLRSRPNVEIGFIYHSLFSNEVETQIEALVVGSNYPAINSGDVRNLKINIPLFPIQQKIAHILTTCDTVIEQTQSAIAKNKAIKQGMLHDLFTCGLDTNGHLRPSYHDAPELYKESELGMIPKEWEVKRFGDFVHLIHGFQFRDYDFTENGIPIVKIGQIKPENVDLSNCSFISKNRIDEFRSIIIRNGDVLMALTGATLGKACQVKKLKNDVLQNYRVGRFEPKNLDEIHKGFLYYTLTTRQFLNQVFSKVNAGAQGNIGKSDFEKPLFKMPDINEQRRIFDRLESLNHKLESEETLLQKYQSIKRGLMGDLLGGKKEVCNIRQ